MALFANETPRQRIMKRLHDLQQKRASWETHWREISENMLPRRLRLNPEGEFERGDKLNSAINDSTPLHALRANAAGLASNLCSAATPWFRTTLRDPELAEWGPVKAYRYEVEQRMRWIFSMSNWYQALTDGVFPDISSFGTAALIMDESPRRVLNCYAMPLGEYYLAANGEGTIDTCYRDIPMTVRQVVTRFCQDGNLSRLTVSTRNAYSQGDYEHVVRVIHAIEPNDEYEPGKVGREGFAWSSMWMERGVADERYLKKSGYESFPVLAPRWSVLGGDVYGRGPGMDTLPDCKELQWEAGRLAKLIDMSATPPMKGSAGLRSPTLIPGETTILPDGPQAGTFEPSIRIDPNSIQHVMNKIGQLQRAVNAGFFADLWLRIQLDERAQRATATEIEEGRQELMLQLGPVLERMNPELLSPGFDRAYQIAERLNLLPEAPKEIQGEDLQVEFISVIHQAQKARGLIAVRTLRNEVAAMAQLKPAVLDKLEVDAMTDEIADMLGTKPSLILDAEGVAKARQARADMERQQAQAAQAAEMAKGAAALGKTPAPSSDNALGALLGTMSPLAIAPGGLPQ